MKRVSISIEVELPDALSEADVIVVGKRVAPPEWEGVTDVGEALQWVFADKTGLAAAMLYRLGINWNVIENGATP